MALHPKPSAYFCSVTGFFLYVLSVLSTFARAQELSDAQLDAVSARLDASALLSWELGTRAQAILELNATRYSVFYGGSLPPPASIPSSMTQPMQPYIAIAQQILETWNGTAGGPPQPLIFDGSAADPASNGVTVLIANWTGASGGDYAAAAKSQLDFLYSDNVPKTSDGAISHRTEQVQLWSDFVFMVPPFLAYYGAVTQNRTLLVDSYNQCRLYRSYLRDNTTGLWRHVVLGTSGNDDGFWSTGNGWAAAGMLRVHATIVNSQYANTLKTETRNLASWVEEIHAAMYANVDSTSIFTNYADQPASAPSNFYDASGTALLAATVYRARLELKQRKYRYLSYADNAWAALFNSSSSSGDSNATDVFNGYTHFTSEGWLRPVVDPHSFGLEGNQSAEGQAFVIMLQAARRDSKSSGARSIRAKHMGMWCVGVILGMWTL